MSPAGAATLPDPAATGTINDDDDAPMLVLTVAPASIAEAGGTSSAVTVSTGSGSTFPDAQTITLALSGTATETDDYTINSKSLTLSAGVGSAASAVTATVTAVDDTLSEGGETVLIDATRAPGNLAVGTRQTLTIIDDDRHATGAPATAGTPQAGMILTASAGTIADADGLTRAIYSYQWIQVDGGTETDISGATGSTYTLAPADVGKTLKVRASFTDDAGFAESRTSDATATVIAAASMSCPAPSIETRRNIWVSTLTVGERRFGLDVGSHGFLSSASVGALTSRTFNTGLNGYTVGGVTVGRLGGTAGNLSFITTRELTATEKAALRLHVCGDSYSFSDASRLGSGTSSSYIWNTSLNWSTVSTRTLYLSLPANNMATGAPVISGTAEIGQDLSAGISGIADLDGLPSSFTYQWSRVDADGTSNETSITSAIAATYTLTRDDGGKKVKVQVSFTDNLGNKEKLTSAAYPSTGTVPGPPNTAATGAPAITGTPQVGMMLTASAGTIADADGLSSVSYSYQWIQVAGGTETDISGKTGSTYTPVPADVGKTLKVRASFTDDDNNNEALTSAETAGVTAAPAVATGIADASGVEGAAITFTVTLAAAAAQELTVNYATSVETGDTAAQTDFTAGSGPLTFMVGDTQKTFTVSTRQDRIDESAETFTVTLSGVSPAGAATLPDPTATGTINDDDAAPMLVLTVAPASIAEAGGTSSAVTVSTGSGSTFSDAQTITLALSGTATENDDYTLNSTSLTLPAGVDSAETSVTATVTAVDDNYDDDAETIIITASHGANPIGSGTITITDDDAAPMLVLTVAPASIAEDGGTSSAVTVSTGSGSTFPDAQTITLALSGTATENDDYTLNSTSLTLPAGVDSAETSVTATVTAVDDNYDDDAETIIITASHGSSTIGSATITINDDDAAPMLVLTVAPASIAEAGGTSTVTVSTGSGSTFPDAQTITLALSGTATETDDYTLNSTSLTLPAGVGSVASSVTATVTAVDDNYDDDAETIIITARRVGSTIGSGTITINDDDVAAPVLVLSVAPASIAEAGGTSTVTVSTGSGSTFPDDQTITLALSGTATENGDYTLNSTSLTLPAGVGSGASSVTATVTAVDDNYDDDAETIIITASRGDNTIGSETITINDDDDAPVLVLSVVPASIAEDGGTSTVTVSTGSGSTFTDAQTITLALSGTATETDDYTINLTSLTLPAGVGSVASSVTATVTAVDDNYDNDAATVIITAGRGANTIGSATITINDDDDPPVLVLSVAPASIAEAGGTSTVTVSTGSGSTFPDDQTIMLALLGTATENDDYTINSKSLTLPAGVGSVASSVTATVTAVDDDFFEGTANERLSITGSRDDTDFGATRTITIMEDEEAPKLTLTLTHGSISEDGGSTTVTASVAPRTVDAFTVTFRIDPTAPATDADYNLSGTLSFAALSDSPTGTVTIAANDNRVDRPDKTVSVTGTSSQSYFRAAEAVTLTIEDEDAPPAPVLEVSPSSIGENAGTSTVTVTTAAGSTFPDAQTVTLTLTGTGTEIGDYTIVSKSLTLPAGSGLDVSTVTTMVTGVDDKIDDDAETILIDAAIGSVTVGAQQSIVIDDDDLAPVLEISVSDLAIAENGGTSTVTVTTGTGSTYATDQPLTLSLSGTATVTSDYSVDSTLTLSAGVGLGASTATTTLTALDDGIDDDDETVVINASRGGTGFGLPQTVTITDDDDPPVLVFTALPASIAENGGVSTVTVGTGSGSTYATDQTITLAVAGTAIEGSDYTIESKTLTLPAGVGSVMTLVTGVDDGLFEGNEDQTVLVTATHDGTDLGTQTVAVEDDEANSQVVLTLTPDEIEETASPGNPNANKTTVTATVSPPAEHPFVLWIGVHPISPATGDDVETDFPVPAFGLLDFAAGATASTGLATISAVDNDLDTPDKELTISGTIAAYDGALGMPRTTGIRAPRPSPTLTIRDNDDAPDSVSLSLNVTSVAEIAGATDIEVTATLNSGLRESDVVVTVTVGSGTGGDGAVSGVDFVSVAALTLSIIAGDTSVSAGFTLTPLDDRIAESDEVLSVTGATNDPLVGVPDAVEITITDNDEAPQLSFGVDTATIEEDGGTATVTVSTGTGSTFADEQTITLSVSGSATAGTDYTISARTLTLPAGAGSEVSSVTATLTALDDNVYDDAETIVIGALLDGVAFGTEQTVTIADDEGIPAVTLVLTPPSIAEDGGTSTVTATVSPASATAFTVDVTAAPVSPAEAGDFQQSGTTLSFAAGETLSTGLVTIAAVDNTTDTPDRQVSVSGTVSAPDVSAPADATLTILDDDTAPVLALEVEPATIAEDGGTATVTVTTGTGSTFDSPQVITLVLGGTATQGEDYTVSATELTLPRGEASVTATVTGLDDRVFEGDETLLISGQADGAAFGEQQTLTITDNEAAPRVTLVLTPDSIGEDGGTATVTATATVASAEAFTVTVAATADAPATDADFTLSGATLSFAANATESTGEVTIAAVDNGVDAADKTLRVSGTVSREDVAAPADATLTIADDDEASTTVTLTVTPQRIDEGAGATPIEVTVALDAGARESDTVIEVSLSGAGEAAALQGVDYTPVSDFSLTIPANETSAAATFTLTPIEDRVDEPDETLTLTGIAGDRGIGVPEAATLTLADNDDVPELSLRVAPASIAENGGTATVTVTTGEGSTFAGERTVALTLSGTATEGEDYRITSRALTLPPGSGANASSVTATLTALDDNVDDDAETIVIGASRDGAPFGTEQTVTIADDEGIPAVTLVLTPPSIAEDGGTSTVTATVSPASATAFTVDVTAAPVSPAEAGDFQQSGTTLSFAAGETLSTGSVTIVAVDNTTDTPDRQVSVSGTVSSPDVSAPADATLTILDDDTAPVLTLEVEPATIAEDGGTATVTVTTGTGSTFDSPQVITLVLGGTATQGEDYTVSATELTLPRGEASVTATVTGLDDRVFEGDETLLISGQADGAAFGEQQTLTITDNEAAPRVTLVLTPDSIGEDGGTATVTATATVASAEAFTVTVAATADAPATDADFTLSGATLSFAANATQSTGNVTIAAVDNGVDAADKTLRVSGTVSREDVAAPADATLTIADDDEASTTVTLTVTPQRIDEGAGATPIEVTVALDAGARESDTVIEVSLSGAGEAAALQGVDYTPVSDFSLTIPANETSAAATFTLTPIEDRVDEPDETLTLTGIAGDRGIGVPEAATLTLADNDDVPELSLRVAPASIAENGGTATVTVTTGEGSTFAGERTVALTLSGTATEGEDYRITSRALTLPPGSGANASSVTATLTARTTTSTTMPRPS